MLDIPIYNRIKFIFELKLYREKKYIYIFIISLNQNFDKFEEFWRLVNFIYNLG